MKLGIHAGLKIRCRKTCKFKSCHPQTGNTMNEREAQRNIVIEIKSALEKVTKEYNCEPSDCRMKFLPFDLITVSVKDDPIGYFFNEEDFMIWVRKYNASNDQVAAN